MINGVSYQGVVTAKNSEGLSVQLSNTGTALLGNTICKALAGYDISNALPTYLDIQIKQNNGTWVSVLNRKLPFTGIKYSTFDDISSNNIMGQLNLNSVVLFSDKKRTTVGENDDCRLVLYSKDSQVLAHVTQAGDINVSDAAKVADKRKLISSIYNNITSGVDCVIEWVMTFYNK